HVHADLLPEATARLRPDGGHRPLLEIAEHRCVVSHGTRRDLDANWALRLLAAAYPAHALPLVDRQLGEAHAWTRYAALAAVAELPADEARPRLLHGASDGAADIAERARDLSLKRF